MKLRKQCTHDNGSDTSLNRDVEPREARVGADSWSRFASATLSDTMSFNSGFFPRWILSTTFSGMGGRAGDRMRGVVLDACGAVTGSSCWERSITQSAGGMTEGVVVVDSGVDNVLPRDGPASENNGIVEMAEADGIPEGTVLVVDSAGLALLAADTPTAEET